MPAAAAEIDAALDEGVRIEFLANPVSVLSENGRIRAVECTRMRLGEPDSSGRRRPVPIESSQFELPLDGLIYAIRQQPDLRWLDGDCGVQKTRWGTIEADPLVLTTGEPGVFAGGDAVLGPASVVEAIAHGRQARSRNGPHNLPPQPHRDARRGRGDRRGPR